jgi:hypothetical protein
MTLYTHLLQVFEEADKQPHTFLTSATEEAEEGLKQLHISNQS